MNFGNKFDQREKLVLRLAREDHRVLQAWHAQPSTPLPEPIQRGWVKSFVLRDDITRREDVRVFRTILAAVNVRVHARNREFKARDGSKIGVHPRIIPAREWNQLGWPISVTKHFLYGWWRWRKAGAWARPFLGYKLAHPWMLVEHVEPHFVTHRRPDQPEARERLAEIEGAMARLQGWPRVWRMRGRAGRWRQRNPES
jgi:hypothetical protein